MNERTFSSQEISLRQNNMVAEEEKRSILLTVGSYLVTMPIIFLLFLVFSR